MSHTVSSNADIFGVNSTVEEKLTVHKKADEAPSRVRTIVTGKRKEKNKGSNKKKG